MPQINTLDLAIGDLPYSLEAEQSVLGAILIEPSCMTTVMEYLSPECFYRQEHRELFTILIRMFTAGSPVDVVTVLNEAIRDSVFPSSEDAKMYLVTLMQQVPSIANTEHYCKIVEEKFYLRSLINAATDIMRTANEGEEDARTLLDLAEQKIYDIRKGKESDGLTKINEIIVETYDHLHKLSSEDKEKYQGLRTGFSLLDVVMSGLNRSDLILLAARPGMGKTSFAMNLVTNVARKYDKQVAVFSLEMSKEQLVTRMLSSEALISSNSLRTGTITADEWVRLASAADNLSRMQIYIDDTAAITVPQMKAKLRRMKDLGLVVIDYLQLMTSGRRTENRVLEISEMTRNLKIMAKELDVPVITLSQLSRAPETRQDHRPVLSDLRDSGSIEQDADIVMFLYRDAVYNKETEEANIAECIIGKNRHGETGSVKLGWDGQHTRFMNLELHRDAGSN